MLTVGVLANFASMVMEVASLLAPIVPPSAKRPTIGLLGEAGGVTGAGVVGRYVPEAKGQESPVRANMWSPGEFDVQPARAPVAAASARSVIAVLATSTSSQRF